ncbi:hypothetical protein [Brackiella oedipodis]|uniref:hypothetical protein n=1 Tax=Brackiella oedipodis TaxID=124225 RepID=UPI00048CD9E2|nr:hypothetical protein [Brackiella oedipodis]
MSENTSEQDNRYTSSHFINYLEVISNQPPSCPICQGQEYSVNANEDGTLAYYTSLKTDYCNKDHTFGEPSVDEAVHSVIVVCNQCGFKLMFAVDRFLQWANENVNIDRSDA